MQFKTKTRNQDQCWFTQTLFSADALDMHGIIAQG